MGIIGEAEVIPVTFERDSAHHWPRKLPRQPGYGIISS